MAPDPGGEITAELHQLMIEQLDEMVLKGEISPAYTVGDLIWDPESSSYTVVIRMALILPLTDSG